MNSATPILILLVGVLAGCAKLAAANPTVAPTTQPSIADIATSYTSYKKITAEAVNVNPEIAMLCTMPQPKHIEAAIKTKGPTPTRPFSST